MADSLRIGISANFMHADPHRALFKGKTLQYVEQRLAMSVWRAGATPVLLAELADEAGTRAMIDAVDGLLLSGGADVAPESYGAESIDARWPGDARRDAYECHLVELAQARAKPILGVCRGAQILNVALGGTLWQDLQTQVDGALVHRDWEHYDELGHDIRITAGSWVSEVYGDVTRLAVNSVHHQGLRELAPGLKATAWAPDGIVEAIEAIDDLQWISAVQWHPEWLEAEDRGNVNVAAPGGRAGGEPIFEAFARACAARKTT
jgi:putative glutamine amidotransferase